MNQIYITGKITKKETGRCDHGDYLRLTICEDKNQYQMTLWEGDFARHCRELPLGTEISVVGSLRYKRVHWSGGEYRDVVEIVKPRPFTNTSLQ